MTTATITLKREQVERALTFIKARWAPDDIEWLRKLPPAEAKVFLAFALLGATPVEL